MDLIDFFNNNRQLKPDFNDIEKLEAFCSSSDSSMKIHTMSYCEKKRLAEAILKHMEEHSPTCFDFSHGDFMLQSIIGLQAARKIFCGGDAESSFQKKIVNLPDCSDVFRPRAGWGCELPTTQGPLPLWMPASYIGGNMVFGRLFRINLTALLPENGKVYIGLRGDGGKGYGWQPLKGLIESSIDDPDWTVMEVDRNKTDDFTAMVYGGYEKEFWIEICRYRPEASHDILLRYTCF